MTYAVLGVTGNTGKVVAETLLEQGKRVRAVVRDGAKAAAFVERGAEVAVADVCDANALARAFTGATGAYVLIPPSFAPEFRKYQQTAADAIRSAAERAKLPHLVLLSSVSAQHATGNGPIAGVHYAEQQLRSLTTTHSTFLRAASFIDNVGSSLGMLEKGLLPSFFPKDLAFDMVATRDIGLAAASLLIEGTDRTQVVDVKGPRVSYGEMAEVFSKLTGKTISVLEAPLEGVIPMFESFGVPNELASLYREMFAGIISGHVSFEPGNRTISGKTSLETALRGLLARKSH